MTWRDDAYFLDVLLATRRIDSFSQGITRDAFDQDEIMQLALVRLIQIIGEAARKISDDSRDAHPEIEWSNIIGMRNRVVHQYAKVDLDIVWLVITQKTRSLFGSLRSLFPLILNLQRTPDA